MWPDRALSRVVRRPPVLPLSTTMEMREGRDTVERRRGQEGRRLGWKGRGAAAALPRVRGSRLGRGEEADWGQTLALGFYTM